MNRDHYIIINNKEIDYPYYQTHVYKETGKEFTHLKGATRRVNRPIRRIVLHHDATLSASACYDILKRRNLGTHFSIDNDGRVWQFADPHNLTTWASSQFNGTSINIDISNAVLTQYKDSYDPKREEGNRLIHGRRVTGLLPYPIQIRSSAMLIAQLLGHYDLEPVVLDRYSVNMDLSPSDTKYTVIGHYHFARNKIDPFGVNWKELEEYIHEYKNRIFI